MKGGTVAGAEQPAFPPRGRIGDDGKDGEKSRQERGAEAEQPRYFRSCPAAICSEMRPNRNTTTASWMSSADPMGILPKRTTFQTP